MIKKVKTQDCTTDIRILFKLGGKDVNSPSTLSLSINIVHLEHFPQAFIYADSYHPEYYEMAINQLKQNPTRLLKSLQIKETGYYEMFASVLFHLMFNEENQLVDCVWKVMGTPNVLQLSEDEEALLKNKNII